MQQTSHPAADWRGRTIFLTGATGLIGIHLGPWLRQHGARVIALVREGGAVSRPGPDVIVTGDVRDHDFLHRVFLEHPIDTVFHLAAQSQVSAASRQPLEAFESNTRGLWNLLDAVRAAGRQIYVVAASTDAVYGDTTGAPDSESSPWRAHSPYAISKLCGELVGRAYSEAFGIPVCYARTSNVYGGGDRNLDRLIPGTIAAVLQGVPPKINSSGGDLRDYLFVDDACDAYIALAAAMHAGGVRNDVFNFSSGTSTSVLDVVRMILELMGRPDLAPRLAHPAAANAVKGRFTSAIKAHEQLGWQPAHSLGEGLRKTIDWYLRVA